MSLIHFLRTVFLSLRRRDLLSLWSQCCRKKSRHCRRILTKFLNSLPVDCPTIFPVCVNGWRLTGGGGDPIWFADQTRHQQDYQMMHGALSVPWGRSGAHNHTDKRVGFWFASDFPPGFAVIPPPLCPSAWLTGASARRRPVSHFDEAGQNVLSEILTPPPPPPPPPLPLHSR